MNICVELKHEEIEKIILEKVSLIVGLEPEHLIIKLKSKVGAFDWKQVETFGIVEAAARLTQEE